MTKIIIIMMQLIIVLGVIYYTGIIGFFILGGLWLLFVGVGKLFVDESKNMSYEEIAQRKREVALQRQSTKNTSYFTCPDCQAQIPKLEVPYHECNQIQNTRETS
ncbi:MAG: hypothetical protein ACRC0X_02045 [Brevinema sp.]